MDYIHSREISHRDLTLDNILVDDNVDLRIVDFGLSCTLAELLNPGLPNRIVGDTRYIAPEVD